MLIHNTNSEEGLFLSDNLYRFFRNAYDKNLYYQSYIVSFVVNYFSGICSSSCNDTIKKKVFNKNNYLVEDDDGYIKVGDGQKMKLGKLILKISDRVSQNKVTKYDLIVLERLVDDYKSWYKFNNSLKFNIYKGLDILKGYDRHYHIDNNGMLQDSCMNGKPFLLGLYTDNEDKVSLLVLVDNNNKIHGRALLWKLDNCPFMFMDRIYGEDCFIKQIFIEHAKKNGFAYRNQNSSYEIYLPDGTVKHNHDYKMVVKVKMNHLNRVPYMDTFSILSIWDSTIRNNSKKFIIKYKNMQRTNGTIEERSVIKVGCFKKYTYQ